MLGSRETARFIVMQDQCIFFNGESTCDESDKFYFLEQGMEPPNSRKKWFQDKRCCMRGPDMELQLREW